MADDKSTTAAPARPGGGLGAAGDSDKKKTLKEQFSDGKIPTGAHFGNLIDAFVLIEALEASDGVLARLDALEHPKDGSFQESVSIGRAASRWDIHIGRNGALDIQPQSDNTAGWVRMPARAGSLSRDTDSAKFAQIEALDVLPNQLNGRDFYLAAPRPGPFAVELVATVEPEPADDGPESPRKGFFARTANTLLRPPMRPAMIRAVAVSAGSGTPASVDYHATPATTVLAAASRAAAEFLLVLAAVFFLADNINSEIQQIEVQDDWFEKSTEVSIPDRIACPVMQGLAAVKLYKMPAGKCVAAADGSAFSQSGGAGGNVAPAAAPAAGDAASGPASGGASSVDPTWLEELTGQAGTASNRPAGSANAASGSASAAPAAAGTTASSPNAAPAVSSPVLAAGAAADSDSTTLRFAYSVAALAGIVILLFLWLRTVPLWIAMRRSLSVEWIKDPKAAGGLKLILRRRGLLPTPTARVRYHMTQLWG